ncbi:phage integrase central domain-containing protein [Knoellia sp. LjRoot47]|uniref:phage integrase central domain-containing protein n=1 Tax=Knoellia sp. LjRoot47 TaxID=3342330 RepID=UPI003ECF8DA5
MAGKANRRGFGYLRKLPSKRWQASYYGPDMGTHHAPRTFDYKGDTEGWLAAERAMIQAGTWTPPKLRLGDRGDAFSFEAYAKTWLRDRRLKPRTREGYEHLLQRYLLDDFGDLALAKITPATVRAWWGKLDEATPTVNARAYSLLKAIMNTAVTDEEIVANPCRIRSATSGAARPRDPPCVHRRALGDRGEPA